ncbi:MAG: molybdopterin-guanine dinucleotide biosynthesis protein MobB [Candidatus Cloacimonetes bacterium HGW-Cloacimonetes-3]|jgi:molybdopterin-guanine dinucleotide biosynthesis protein B|nr:MAG: molybdopterin-guanine dinucleotide biosynthesis protein MobB [Candidatus Cloacimonetes bacterium HGW-Cloacimonetes-3]
MKAIGVIGYHHTGKTTLVTAIVAELKKRGFSVVSIKDIHSEAYHADTDGKNTALHAKAGSEAVFAKGLYDSALLFPRILELKEMISYLKADYLVIEGMKDAPVPKLVCAKDTTQLDELVDGTCIGISGLIADELSTYSGLPVFCLQKDFDALMDTVLKHSFEMLPMSEPECCSACGFTCSQMAIRIVTGKSKRSDCVLDNAPDLKLMIGEEQVIIVPFVQKVLKDVIISLVDNLKGINPQGKINIEIKR